MPPLPIKRHIPRSLSSLLKPVYIRQHITRKFLLQLRAQGSRKLVCTGLLRKYYQLGIGRIISAVLATVAHEGNAYKLVYISRTHRLRIGEVVMESNKNGGRHRPVGGHASKAQSAAQKKKE